MTPAPETEKLYLGNAYEMSFRSTVLSCDELPDANYAVTLEATHFYPESGGQLCDKGTIGDAEVVFVREGENGGVVHVVDKAVAGKVQCEIDWDRRFDHMQQHTGQHVLTRAFIEIAGMPTVSFHMGDDSCTIDIEGEDAGEDVVNAVECLANAIIWEDRNVYVRTVPVDELEEGAVRRSLPDGLSEARIIDVEGFDAVACCGTHVGRTGELGVIKILKQEKVKNNLRIHYVAGRRAFWDYQDRHDVTSALTKRFTTSLDGILDKTEKLSADARQLRRENQKLKMKLAEMEMKRILAGAQMHNEVRFAIDLHEEDDDDYLNLLANTCRGEPDTVVFIGSPGGRVICAASRNLDLDLAGPILEMAGKVGGKGGGKGGFVRVSIPQTEAVETFLHKVCNHVKENL